MIISLSQDFQPSRVIRVRLRLWEEIERSYSKPARHYHNLSHLDNLNAVLLTIRHRIIDWLTVVFSIAYHDISPPPILYHGTCVKFIDSILSTGLEKKDRHHVHLSSDLETAINVGSRHEKPFVFEILAEEMSQNGFEFYLSDNQVWLTDHVPIRFLREFTNNK